MSTNLWRRIRWVIGFALFVLYAMAAHAQPQPPVVWGNAWWFGIGCGSVGQTLAVVGDTIIVVDQGHDTTRPIDPLYPKVTSSFDHGHTWRPWQMLGTQFYEPDFVPTSIAAAAGSAYAFVKNIDLAEYHVYRSTDGGTQWALNRFRQAELFSTGFAADTQVMCIDYSHPTLQSTTSLNRGDTWRADQPITDLTTYVGPDAAAFTSGHAILLAVRTVSNRQSLFVSNADRFGQNWTQFRYLPNQPTLELCAGTIVGDTNSEAAMVVETWYPTGGSGQNVYAQRTIDGGLSWESPCLLTTNAFGSEVPVGFCQGKLWGVAWREAEGPDSRDWGMYWRMSANHGKDWYAPQHVDTTYSYVYYTGGQFYGDTVQIFWQSRNFQAQPRDDYRSAIGVISRDTTPPVVNQIGLSPDTIRVGQQAHFVVSVTENDTLSRVELSIRSSDTSIVTPMIRTGTVYAASWTVPHTGRYLYRVEAEDFWENVGTYPDSGWASFVTQGWIDNAHPVILHPSAFSLSVSPNPFNATAKIMYSLPKAGRVSIEVFDITGRKTRAMQSAPTGIVDVGEHTVEFDGTGLASGIYFVRIRAGEFEKTEKMVLLK